MQIVGLIIYISRSIARYNNENKKNNENKLQNCWCNQFHYIGTYKQVGNNSMTRNRGGNNGSEK